MTIPVVGAGAQARAARASSAAESRGSQRAWGMIGWIGGAFVVMGVTDIALGWYPTAFGNAEWEFGMISATLNGFALPSLGFFLLLASAIARGNRMLGKGLAVTLAVLALGLVTLSFLYVTVVPLALNSVAADKAVAMGMRKAVIKAGMLFVAYGALFVVGVVGGWRTAPGDQR